MKLVFTPVLALVLSLGLRPAELWHHVSSSAGEDTLRPYPSVQGSPDWTQVDEWLGIGPETVYEVKVTGYSSSRDQCDADPFTTASNKQVRDGIVALSRDLLRRYNPDAPFDWGDRVHIEGVGEFVVEDSMNARYRHRADIWFPDRRSAANWGIQSLKLSRVPENPLDL